MIWRRTRTLLGEAKTKPVSLLGHLRVRCPRNSPSHRINPVRRTRSRRQGMAWTRVNLDNISVPASGPHGIAEVREAVRAARDETEEAQRFAHGSHIGRDRKPGYDEGEF